MTTTVLTMTLTSLAADSVLAGGSSPRTPRRVTAVAAMLAGAWLGVVVLRTAGPLACLIMGSAALAVTMAGFVQAGRRARQATGHLLPPRPAAAAPAGGGQAQPAGMPTSAGAAVTAAQGWPSSLNRPRPDTPDGQAPTPLGEPG
jgi:hypothetical protein